jgi:hypothetical protein
LKHLEQYNPEKKTPYITLIKPIENPYKTPKVVFFLKFSLRYHWHLQASQGDQGCDGAGDPIPQR